MRLRRFEIKNFKAIQNLSLEWDDLLVLIGENNCGKSCVLSALALFLGGSAIRDPLLFHKHRTDIANAIELTGHFDLLSTTEQEQIAVKGRMNGAEWILKKKYWLERNNESGEEKSSWKELLYSYSAREELRDWPAPDSSWSAFPEIYQPLIEQIPNRPTRLNALLKEELRTIVRQQQPQLIVQSPASWIENPGGGGNWKSNANSILPRCILVNAVQEATEETNSKDASAYGKLINLVVETRLSQRAEILRLKEAFQTVLDLFCRDDSHPERQAQEIRQLEDRLNEGLREVIGGQARIQTEPAEINTFLLPSTSLVIRDASADIDTKVEHQGHGLQRTLLMTLLQMLAEAEEVRGPDNPDGRSTILAIEEPELYMHPQMERRMRDLLYRLSGGQRMQVACCTHSPVFVDVANRHKAIVLMSKGREGLVTAKQVTTEIFVGTEDEVDRERLQTVARFNPFINELFFSRDVVLLEEFTAIAAFERAAELNGLFDRHPAIRRNVTMIDTSGKGNIPAFQRVLNAFAIPYRILHDEDRSNPQERSSNLRILAIATNPSGTRPIHMVGPESIENLLGYQSSKSSGKPFAAVREVEKLHASGGLPAEFIAALNFAYFGSLVEPAE
jgi:predicted ATP-dependent endonuclease of OLD family